MSGAFSHLGGIQRGNKCWKTKKVIFLPPLPFCCLSLHLLFETEAEEERKHTYLDTYTHICTTSSTHLFNQFASEISVKSESGPISLPMLPISFHHNASNKRVSVLCGHMSVSSSHRLSLCSLLQEMSEWVSVESKWDKGFEECREINNKQVCRCCTLQKTGMGK